MGADSKPCAFIIKDRFGTVYFRHTITVAEPDRENYEVLRKGLCRLERLMAGRLAQNVLPLTRLDNMYNCCTIVIIKTWREAAWTSSLTHPH